MNADWEGARLEALDRYRVLDSRPEEPFDRITRMVRTVMKTPIALVSLVDDKRQWFKSRQGLEVCETSRDVSFCTHAIEADTPFLVTDAATDPRFRSSPLVVAEPRIRFYLGIPLVTPEGHRIGTLCAIDRVPREPTADQIAVMQDLAQLVVDELELRLMAMLDGLTGILNRKAFALQAQRELDRMGRYGGAFGLILFDIDNFKRVNDTWGHGIGDIALQHVVGVCQATVRAQDFVGRIGGEEFAIGLPETDLDGTLATAERLRAAVAAQPLVAGDIDVPLTVSLGLHGCSRAPLPLSALLNAADVALYRAKRGGRNRSCVHHEEGDVSTVPAA